MPNRVWWRRSLRARITTQVGAALEKFSDADLHSMRGYHLCSAERVMAEVASEDVTPLELEALRAILRPTHGRVL